jgi:hypothetical protein
VLVVILIALVLLFTVGLIPLIVLSERGLQAQQKNEPKRSARPSSRTKA